MINGVQNQSAVNAFILLGLTDYPQLQAPLFAILLMVYVVTVMGNLAIIYMVVTNSRLHSPMYDFLRNLAFLEMCYISVTVPKMITNYATGIQITVYPSTSALSRYTSSTSLGPLNVLGYALWLSIDLLPYATPLHYTTLMSRSTCVYMLVLSSTVAFVDAALHAVLTSKLHFCEASQVWNFFCDVPPLLIISCSDTTMNEVLLKAAGSIVGLITALVIVISYAYLIATILSMKATNGKWKPFSTCTSHIIALSLFYGSGLFTYIFQSSNTSSGITSTLFLGYSVITPFLNPIIYSLRNKEIQQVMGTVVQTMKVSRRKK